MIRYYDEGIDLYVDTAKIIYPQFDDDYLRKVYRPKFKVILLGLMLISSI